VGDQGPLFVARTDRPTPLGDGVALSEKKRAMVRTQLMEPVENARQNPLIGVANLAVPPDVVGMLRLFRRKNGFKSDGERVGSARARESAMALSVETIPK